MTSRVPMIQIKWTDDTVWSDYQPLDLSRFATSGEQEDYVRRKFRETKKKHDLPYDIEVRTR